MSACMQGGAAIARVTSMAALLRQRAAQRCLIVDFVHLPPTAYAAKQKVTLF